MGKPISQSFNNSLYIIYNKGKKYFICKSALYIISDVLPPLMCTNPSSGWGLLFGCHLLSAHIYQYEYKMYKNSVLIGWKRGNEWRKKRDIGEGAEEMWMPFRLSLRPYCRQFTILLMVCDAACLWNIYLGQLHSPIIIPSVDPS